MDVSTGIFLVLFILGPLTASEKALIDWYGSLLVGQASRIVLRTVLFNKNLSDNEVNTLPKIQQQSTGTWAGVLYSNSRFIEILRIAQGVN